SRTPAPNCPVVCLTVKPVGEPDAGDRHVRFDERGWETACCRMAQATAPILDSTERDFGGCLLSGRGRGRSGRQPALAERPRIMSTRSSATKSWIPSLL